MNMFKKKENQSNDVTAPTRTERGEMQRRWLYAVLFYAGAVTATLVTISVVGAIYLEKVKTMCSFQGQQFMPPPLLSVNEEGSHQKKTYKLDDSQTECDLDLLHDKEIIRFSGKEYGGNSIMVVDFQKGLCGIHDGAKNLCYLVGGLDGHLPNATVLDKLLSGQVGDASSMTNAGMYYHVIADRPVTNLALLPEELYSYCWGKPVYWLERIQPQTRHREKRGGEFCFGVYIVKWGVCVGFWVVW